MRELPSGAVTLLFTDIEGSTRLLHELGEGYAEMLAEHRRVLREAFAKHGGVEVDTQGDAFFVAFADAGAALGAAAQAQQSLGDGPIQVRMGLHTGEPERTAEGYAGVDVHLGARIAAAGHGGQVLLSRASAELVETELSDLGEHRVKDFEQPVAIFQLGRKSFPPLKTVSNTNLPRPASSFIGREREIGKVVSLLRDRARLVTLTGTSGSGKTRLAIQAAAELVGDYPAGVFWVGLATLRDPALVLETVAQTLGAKEELALHVGERRMLLLLDNLEQVMDVVPDLARLLEACPNLALLCTSREALRLSGELEYPVLPLQEEEAIELFMRRSQTEADATTTEICRRLDHLPLAIELAAARVKALPSVEILKRLERRLPLLTGGARDLPERQRTLRAAIEWSHDLLDEREQQLFRRLAVFAGGCTLDAAERVADAELDTVQSLVEKSLVRYSDGRYWMLETIREFAVEQLAGSAEAEEMGRRHAALFLGLAEQAKADFAGRDQIRRFSEVEGDADNYRAALEHLRLREAPDRMLSMAGALFRYWFVRGHLEEGAYWLGEALAMGGSRPSSARAEALAAAAQIAYRRGKYENAKVLNEQAIDACRALGDRSGIGRALNRLADLCEAEGDLERAESLWKASAAIARETGDTRGLAVALGNVSDVVLRRGDFSSAVRLIEESLALFRQLDDVHGTAVQLQNLGAALVQRERCDEGVPLLKESLALLHELESPVYAAHAISELASVALSRGDPVVAARLLGSVDAVLEETGGTLAPSERSVYADSMATSRGRLDKEAFHAAWERGRSVTLDEAVEYALSAID
jgi:predicted ATPase